MSSVDDPPMVGSGTDTTAEMEVLKLLLKVSEVPKIGPDGKPLSLEERGQELLELHTRIKDALGMSAIDEGMGIIEAEFGKTIASDAQIWRTYLRRNLAAEGGARGDGILQSIAAILIRKSTKAGVSHLGDLGT